MNGKITIVYPNGNFVAWVEDIKRAVRGFQSQLLAPFPVRIGETYDFELSRGYAGTVTAIKPAADTTHGESAATSNDKIVFAAAISAR